MKRNDRKNSSQNNPKAGKTGHRDIEISFELLPLPDVTVDNSSHGKLFILSLSGSQGEQVIANFTHVAGTQEKEYSCISTKNGLRLQHRMTRQNTSG